MRYQDIRVGDTLILKRDNPYGFGPLTLTVSAITQKGPGYKTPFIWAPIPEESRQEWNDAIGAFRPSDFARKVTP